MGILKLKKNKKYNYTPRYYNNKGEGRPFEIKHKFDGFRKTVGNNSGLKNKVNNAWDDFKNNPDGAANRRILIIIAILFFMFLLIIDFDLSIFFSK